MELLSKASPEQAANIRFQAGPDIDQRIKALAALIEEDPKEAAGLAFSPELLDRFRQSFPGSPQRFETHGTWQGVMEYLIADDVNLATAKHIRRLKTASGTFLLHFAGPEPKLTSGATLTVTGIEAAGIIAAVTSTDLQSADTAAGMACSTFGGQNVATILVNLPNYTLSANITQDFMKGVLYGNAYSANQYNPDYSVDDFWRQNSDGQTWANAGSGVVLGPYSLVSNYNSNGCDYNGLMQAAIQAADGAINFQNYNRVVVVFPANGACSWAGLSGVGCWTNSSPGDGSFTSSLSWLRSDQLPTRDYGVRLSTHELGHALGLGHASSREFVTPPREPLGPLGAAGTLNEYGDLFSTMGSWNLGFYNASHSQEILGWLGSGNYRVVTTAGQYAVQAYETRPASGVVKALKIQRDSLSRSWLWLEYRTSSGNYDSKLNSQVWSGALIHYEDSTTGGRSHLLDFTPGTTVFTDPALVVGQTWTDPYTNLSITVNGISGNSLIVTVNYGAATCTPASPTVTLSPFNPTVAPGGSTTFAVSVRNNSALSCAPATYNLQALQPAGFSGTPSPASLTVAPGVTASSTLVETAGSTTGTYALSVRATDASNPTYTSTGSANITVAPACSKANPTVTLNPATASIITNGSQGFNVTIKNNDSACAQVTYSLLASQSPAGLTGTLSTASVTLGSGASTTVTLTEQASATAGTFQISVKATDSTNTAYTGTGTASLNVTSSCTPANPTVSLSPSSASVTVGSQATFTVNVRNNSSGCSTAVFNLSASIPTGFSGGLASNPLTIAPGTTGSTNLTVTGNVAATGTLTVTATSSPLTGSGSAIITAVTGITTTVSTNSSTYRNRDTIYVTAKVQGAGNGTPVGFMLSKSDGSVVSAQSAAEASGTAIWQYRLAPKDPSGTWTVRATATVSGKSYPSASVSFTVR